MKTDGPSPQLAVPPADAAAPAPRGNLRRRIMIMAAVPVLLLLVGGYFWLTGGRYVSTDNAYVQQDRVTIAPEVPGRIVSAPVRENQIVAAGDVLFVLDPEPYRIGLASAEAGLATARLDVEKLRADHSEAVAALSVAEGNASLAHKAFDRQQGLLAKGVASQAAYDQAENALHSAEQALTQAKGRLDSALAALGGNAAIQTEDHPLVRAAVARRDQAALDLKRTTVTAPAAGVIAQADRLLVGQQVTSSTAVLSLVETGSSWIEANFKETELTHMAIGQSARVTIDAYPGRKLSGVVTGIGAGTGAEFALLPAQNATGNWVKVVQRVPVHIRIGDAVDGITLRSGFSASVEIDTETGPGTAAAAR